jgi:hypothetical protein
VVHLSPMYLNTIISWAALHDWDSYEFCITIYLCATLVMLLK